jgi:hypothetical protein
VNLRTTLLPLLLAACAAPPAVSSHNPPAELVGRTAGTPQHCLTFARTEPLRVSGNDGHLLLYDNGRTIWANDLGPSCGFSVDDVLVTEPLAGRYCRGDVVRSFDRTSRIPGPSCALGDFVPYTRPPR